MIVDLIGSIRDYSNELSDFSQDADELLQLLPR